MRSGLMDRIIQIMVATTTIDANGTPQRAWAVFATMYAQLLQRSTNEFMLKELGEDSVIVVVFRIRWKDGLSLANQVTYNGTQYRIADIKEIGRREALELRCVAVTS